MLNKAHLVPSTVNMPLRGTMKHETLCSGPVRDRPALDGESRTRLEQGKLTSFPPQLHPSYHGYDNFC